MGGSLFFIWWYGFTGEGSESSVIVGAVYRWEMPTFVPRSELFLLHGPGVMGSFVLRSESACQVERAEVGSFTVRSEVR